MSAMICIACFGKINTFCMLPQSDSYKRVDNIEKYTKQSKTNILTILVPIKERLLTNFVVMVAIAIKPQHIVVVLRTNKGFISFLYRSSEAWLGKGVN